MTLPANTYPGQTDDVHTVAATALLVGTAAVPDTTVEAVLLEWVRTADAPEFQKIRQLIRDPLPA